MNLQGAIDLIRKIPDYPKPGIVFLDITPLLASAPALLSVTEEFAKATTDSEVIVGIEARGFIFAAALAAHSNKGFIPLRKKGKLPFTTYSQSYELEYGVDSLEVHTDAFKRSQRVGIVDDVLATGGTICAAIELAQKSGAIVDCVVVLIEIIDLAGRKRISEKYPDVRIIALVGN